MVREVTKPSRFLTPLVAAAVLLVLPTSTATTSAPAPATAPTSTFETALAARLLVDVPRTVTLGDRITMRGSLPTDRGRNKVRLLVKDDGRWKTKDSDRANRRGEFVLKTKAAAEGRHTFRVLALRQGRDKTLSRKVVIKVVTKDITITPPPPPPTTQPKGDPNDWTYISAGKSMRWNGCDALTWSYDAAQQPYPGAEADMTRAIEILNAKTGYAFTRAAPGATGLLTVKWATPEQEPRLAGSVVGIGGPWYQSIDPTRNGGTQNMIVKGTVTLDVTGNMPGGYGPRAWGQVMLHEAMHAMGLGHANGVEQVMYAMASDKNNELGAGDLTGLTEVGAAKGCIDPERVAGTLRQATPVLIAE